MINLKPSKTSDDCKNNPFPYSIESRSGACIIRIRIILQQNKNDEE